jgi:hypothetical protein
VTLAKAARPDKREKGRPRTFDASVSTADALDTLLKDRYSGAVNIRGIRFQLRYAVLRAAWLARAWREGGGAPDPRALEARAPDAGMPSTLRFEGLEDVDVRGEPALKPLHERAPAGENARAESVHIQIKTGQNGWTWSKLGDPVVGFLELYRTGLRDFRVVLVADFPFAGDLDALARLRELPGAKQHEIRDKFRKLCAKKGGKSEEADGVLERLSLKSMPEASLRAALRDALTGCFTLADGGALEVYEAAFVARALEWSATRATVDGRDVLEVGRRVGEGLAAQGHYEAVGKHWVGPVTYAADARPDDFFDGKRTRLGHVVDGLDVLRADWLARIDQALAARGVCVLRAPSGSGKSTLAYRYAIEHWPASQAVQVRSAGTAEEVAAVADYLRFRAESGLPVRVLIDVDSPTPRWPEVAAAAAALGLRVLVTVRTEDWERSRLGALTGQEILEPVLSRDEAAAIFAEFKIRGRVHASVDSAAWAFERLRGPPLLLEFVYLITRGQMLEDRLRDQVRAFLQQGEDPKKIEVLRIVTLAGALGAPVKLDALLEAVPLRDDPQTVMGTLVGEYLSWNPAERLVTGLHWVRTDHVARLLHEGAFVPVAHTALQALPLVPPAAVRPFVANALRRGDVDRATFLRGLSAYLVDADTPVLVAVLEGLFEAGESDFMTANRAIFDEIHARMGLPVARLAWSEVAPMVRVKLFDTAVRVFGERARGFVDMQAALGRAAQVPRGLDLVRDTLAVVARTRSVDRLAVDGDLGRLLDWCAVTDVRLAAWPAVRDAATEALGLLDRDPSEVGAFALGLFRYDRAAYDAWFARHRDDVLAYLQESTDAVSLELTAYSELATVAESANAGPRPAGGRAEGEEVGDDEADKIRDEVARHGAPAADLRAVIAIGANDGIKPHDKVMRAVDLYRECLPFVGRYRTQGDYLFPSALQLPVDDTVKAIPRWNLPARPDVFKNVVSRKAFTEPYTPDSMYRVQQRWYAARSAALGVVRGLVTLLTHGYRNQRVDFARIFGGGREVLDTFEDRLRHMPVLYEATPEEERAGFASPIVTAAMRPYLELGALEHWRSGLQNFYRQFAQFLANRDPKDGRLALHNLDEVVRALPGVHAFMEVVFQESPDYFGVRAVNGDERATYHDLLLLVEGFALGIQVPRGEAPLRELRRRRQEREQSALARLTRALGPLADRGLAVVAPTGIARVDGLREVPVAVTLGTRDRPFAELGAVLDALQSVRDVADTFHLIPLAGAERVVDGAYRISAYWLESEEALRNALATLELSLAVPRPLPPEVQAVASDLPLAPAVAPTLGQQAAALGVQAEVLGRRLAAIATLDEAAAHRGSGQGRRETLATRLRDDVAAARAELAEAARTLREAAVAHPGNGSAAARELHAFLDAVEALGAGHGSNNGSTFLAAWSVERIHTLAAALE